MRNVVKPTVQDGLLWTGESKTAVSTPIPLQSPKWHAWLAQHKKFRFKGTAGDFSARRETRHGSHYWYAYRRRDGKLNKAYLGKSEELSLSCLEQAAASLAGKTFLEQLALTTNAVANTPTLPKISNAFPILAKIRPPILPPNLVNRPRLINRINTPVTLISAPGGFGKSTLLNSWLQQQGDMAVAWTTLDADDDQLLRFWSTVVTALQAVYPGFGQNLMPYLQMPSTISPAEIVARLTNELACAEQDSYCTALILDDYHHIQHADIHASIQIWLEHLPHGVQLIIASRTRPPLALGRLRARGMVTELALDDLRFTLEEGSDFLQQHVSERPLVVGDMESLVLRTGGWVAGLTLAVLALNQQQDRRHFINTFSGAHLFLREYFMETALHQQSTAVQHFLLKTSILKQLSGPLCDAVTGQSNGEEMLNRLWQQNLFITRSEEPSWYRYHDLFAEMLLSQLRTQFADQIPTLHRRAAAWYRQKNASADAVRHFLAIEAWEEAASLIEDVVLHELVAYGEDSRLLRWIQQLPESIFQQHKTLLFVYLRLAKLALPSEEIEQFLHHLEIQLDSKRDEDMTADERDVLAEIRVIRQRIQAGKLAILQTDVDPRWQLLDALWIVEAISQPQTEEVGQSLQHVYEQARTEGNLFVVLIAGSDVARRAYLRGQFRQSEKIIYQIFQQALAQRGKLPEPASISLITLSQICLGRNDLTQARQLLRQATAVDPNPTSSNMPVNIAIMRARLQSAMGNHQAALSTIQAARALQTQRPSGSWRDVDLAAYEALFYIPLQNWVEIERLLHEVAEEEHQLSYLVRAEMLFKQERAAATEAILWHLLSQSTYGVSNEPILIPQLLLALTLFKQQKLSQARQVLSEAIRAAAPERFIRPFIDRGDQLIPLLTLTRHTQNLSPESDRFILEILQTLGAESDAVATLPKQKLESLVTAASITEREKEVLQLVSDGCSNREISSQLYISASTVKTHLANIYSKLEVNNRVQAVAEAQALRLI